MHASAKVIMRQRSYKLGLRAQKRQPRLLLLRKRDFRSEQTCPSLKLASQTPHDFAKCDDRFA